VTCETPLFQHHRRWMTGFVSASSGWGRWWRRWRCSNMDQFIGCWGRGRGHLNVLGDLVGVWWRGWDFFSGLVELIGCLLGGWLLLSGVGEVIGHWWWGRRRVSDKGEVIGDWICGILNDLSELVLVWRSERRIWGECLCLSSKRDKQKFRFDKLYMVRGVNLARCGIETQVCMLIIRVTYKNIHSRLWCKFMVSIWLNPGKTLKVRKTTRRGGWIVFLETSSFTFLITVLRFRVWVSSESMCSG